MAKNGPILQQLTYLTYTSACPKTFWPEARVKTRLHCLASLAFKDLSIPEMRVEKVMCRSLIAEVMKC